MNTRTFIHDPKELLEEGTKIIDSSDEYKYIFRVALVNFMLARTATAEEISTFSGVSRRTLTSWVQKVDENGFEALRTVKQPGRTPRLSEKQMAEIKVAITASPEESGYRVWDGITLSDFIKVHFDIDLGIRQCQRIFNILGFSKIRPQKYPSLDERNGEEREVFKKKLKIYKRFLMLSLYFKMKFISMFKPIYQLYEQKKEVRQKSSLNPAKTKYLTVDLLFLQRASSLQINPICLHLKQQYLLFVLFYLLIRLMTEKNTIWSWIMLRGTKRLSA